MAVLQHMTDRQLVAVVEGLGPGEAAVYYRGNISEDAELNPALRSLRDMAQRLSGMRINSPSGSMHYGMGLVILSQRRCGDYGFDYIVTKITRAG